MGAGSVTIIVAVITGILGASGIVNVVLTYLFRPQIFAEVLLDTKSPHLATINVKNNGNAPAKGLDLTLTTSSNITSHNVFSTENYTEKVNHNPKMIQIVIPRFAEGEGSLITIGVVTEPNNNSEDYGVYTTYDTGSTKLVTHVQNATIIVNKQTTTFDYIYGYGLIYIILAIAIVGSYVTARKLEKRAKRNLRKAAEL